jgi:hypothetical protein
MLLLVQPGRHLLYILLKEVIVEEMIQCSSSALACCLLAAPYCFT